MQASKSDNSSLISAVTDLSLLREAGTKQFHQVLRSWMVVQTYAARDEQAREWRFTLFQQKEIFSTCSNESMFLQNNLARKKEAEKSIHQQHVLKSREALLLFQGIAYVSSCMQKPHRHANLHLKAGSRTGVAVQLVTRTWSALKNSIGLRNSKTAHFPYFISDGRTALLHVTMARRDGFSIGTQDTSLNGVEHPVKKRTEVDRVA